MPPTTAVAMRALRASPAGYVAVAQVLDDALDHVDAVGGDQHQPVAKVVLRQLAGQASDGARQPLGRLGRAEDRGDARPLRRAEHFDSLCLLDRLSLRYVDEALRRALHRRLNESPSFADSALLKSIETLRAVERHGLPKLASRNYGRSDEVEDPRCLL
jgi:hypothetical protein